MAQRQRTADPHLRSGDDAAQPERARLHPRPVPQQPDPGRALQPHQPRGDPAGDDAARPGGRPQQLRLHAGRPDQHQPVEQVQHQARSQPVDQGSPRLPAALGRGAGGAAGRRPDRRPAGAAQQLPRRGFPHLRLSRQLGSRRHAGADEPRHVRAQQLVSAARLLQPRSGLGHAHRAAERARARQAVPAARLLRRLSRLGTVGMGRVGQLSVEHHGRPDLGEVTAHHEGRLHVPGGSLRRLRLAHRRRHLQLQSRRHCRLPRQRQPRRHRRQRQRLRQLPARRGAVVGDHDQPLRLGSVALLLRRTSRTTGGSTTS